MSTCSTGFPLRGRTREMSKVGAILECARRHESVLLSIEGAPGYGKTRLLRESAVIAERLGFVTRSISSPGPWSEDVRRSRPETTAPAVLVALDDVDHLDTDAAIALSTSENCAGNPRVVWLVAHRPGADRARFDRLLGDPCGRRDRITLGPLSSGDALLLATDVLDAPPSHDLTQLMHQAGGHPRLLVELLAGMREEGTIDIVDGRARLIARRYPERLRFTVHSILQECSSGCLQLLRAAAISGEEISYQDLATLLRTSPSALIADLEEAHSLGAMYSDGMKTVFRNELLRQLIAKMTPSALHRRLRREAAALRSGRAIACAHRPSPHSTAPAADSAPGPTALNDQQRALIRLVANGLTNQQIARRIGLSPHTVNYHLRKLFRIFDVRSRIDLLRVALPHER